MCVPADASMQALDLHTIFPPDLLLGGVLCGLKMKPSQRVAEPSVTAAAAIPPLPCVPFVLQTL